MAVSLATAGLTPDRGDDRRVDMPARNHRWHCPQKGAVNEIGDPSLR